MSFLKSLFGPSKSTANTGATTASGASVKPKSKSNSGLLTALGLDSPAHKDGFGNGFSMLSDTGGKEPAPSLMGQILGEGTNAVTGGINTLLSATNSVTDLVRDKAVEPLLDKYGGSYGDKLVESSNLQQEYDDASIGPVSELVTKYATVFGMDAVTGTAGEIGDGVTHGSKLHLALTEAGLLTAGEDMSTFEGYKADVLGGAKTADDAMQLVDDTGSQAVSEVYPDLGNGGDKNAQAPGWLETGLGWVHSGLDYGTQGLSHLAGMTATATGHVNQAVGDGFQFMTNMGVDGLQTLGIGPSEKTQTNLNNRYDSGQVAQMDAAKTTSSYLHNLAEPLGDVVADAGLDYGTSFVQGAFDIGQNLGNLGIDLGQAGAVVDNQVKLNHGGGVDPNYMEDALQQANVEQAVNNEYIDTQQNKVDNAVNNIINRTD